MITLKYVLKVFPAMAHPAVDNISLNIKKGEFLVILGGSGSGKSTLLKLINRLYEPDSGEILIDNKPIKRYPAVQLRRATGYVFQQSGLFPHMTVAENVAIKLKLEKRPIDKINERVDALLNLVSLPPQAYRDRYPDQLSGGQQQRVNVARALANDPKYLLMDEPFGALDAITREEIQDEVKALADRLNKTVIFVTHDISEALKLGDRIAIMNEGRLEQLDTPQALIDNPATPFVAKLFATATRQRDQLSIIEDNGDQAA